MAMGCASSTKSTSLRPHPLATRAAEKSNAENPSHDHIAGGFLAAVPVVIDENARGVTLRSEDYSIHTTLRDARLRTLLPYFMEQALLHYSTSIASLPLPSDPLEMWVYGTREEWITHINGHLGDEAAPYRKMGRGGYTSGGKSVLYDLGFLDTLTIAAHEGWHQYVQQTFRTPIPPWLDEGTATWMEGFSGTRDEQGPTFIPWRNMERYGALREVVRADALRPLDAIVSGTPQGFLLEGRDALLDYYAHVWALIHFLNEYEGSRYRAALGEMLERSASGRLQGAVGPRALARQFERQFGSSMAEMDRQFKLFVTDITRRGAGNLVYLGRSPYLERSTQ